MFLRSVKAANGRHEYLRLVENYRQGDKIRQRVVLHVGRKDLLAPHLDALVRLLQADQQNPTWSSREEVSTPQAWTWGSVRVARNLFDSLSLGPILGGTTQRGSPLRRPAAARGGDDVEVLQPLGQGVLAARPGQPVGHQREDALRERLAAAQQEPSEIRSRKTNASGVNCGPRVTQ